MVFYKAHTPSSGLEKKMHTGYNEMLPVHFLKQKYLFLIYLSAGLCPQSKPHFFGYPVNLGRTRLCIQDLAELLHLIMLLMGQKNSGVILEVSLL